MLALAWIGLVTTSLIAGLLVAAILHWVDEDNFLAVLFFVPVFLITGFAIYQHTIGATTW